MPFKSIKGAEAEEQSEAMQVFNDAKGKEHEWQWLDALQLFFRRFAFRQTLHQAVYVTNVSISFEWF